jgi:hypothetical protein
MNFGIKDGDKYTINYYSYKKMLYNSYQDIWLEELSKYYFDCKKIYLTREFTYISFITILRQLCRFHNIEYDYDYDKSISHKYKKYNIYLNKNNKNDEKSI